MAKTIKIEEVVTYLSDLQKFYGTLALEAVSAKEYGKAAEFQAQIDAFEYLKQEIPFTRRVGWVKFTR